MKTTDLTRTDVGIQELRLAQRLLAQRLLARDRRSLLLFDEMEDLLSDPFPLFPFFGRPPPPPAPACGTVAPRSSCIGCWSRRRPPLWTMNDAAGVSSAILRRIMFALELRPPTTRVRARIWTRQLERHGIEAQALASEFEATPGVAAGATAAARLGGGDVETVRRGVRSLSRVLSCAKPPEGTPARFDLALIHADVDPRFLADRLVRSGERRFSLCLQGPPGTGKSALVRYLTERLGLEIIQRQASDLRQRALYVRRAIPQRRGESGRRGGGYRRRRSR